MDYFERYLGIGGRGDGSLEVLFLVVLGMITIVTMSYLTTRYSRATYPAKPDLEANRAGARRADKRSEIGHRLK